jgi:hypothetical protein
MFTQLLVVFLVGLLVLVPVLGFSGAIDSTSSRKNMGWIPLVLLFMAFLGSWITVGPYGSVSLASPFLLVMAWWAYGKPGFSFFFGSAAWFAIGFFCIVFGLQAYLLVDFQTGSFALTHHDDYSYLSLANLTQQTGREAYPAELNRILFGMDYVYQFYHYFEFYLIGLIQKTTRLPNYVVYHFFLQPFLQTLALVQAYLFFRNRLSWSVLVLFPFVILCFSSLRFVCLDEWINGVVPSAYWKTVFFQNYAFPHPLSFYRGYKICLAVIFVLAFLDAPREKSKEIWFLLCLASLVSVALFPICIGTLTLRLIAKWIPERFIFTGVLAFLLATFFFRVVPGSLPVFEMAEFYSRVQQTVNLVFENHYWMLLFGLIPIFWGGPVSWKKSLSGIAAFPLVLLHHKWLFKLLLLYCFGLLFWLIWKGWNSKKGFFLFGVHYSAFLFLFAVVPYFAHVADLTQVFYNLLFPGALWFLAEVLQASNVPEPKPLRIPFLAGFFLFGIPAVVADRKMPLRPADVPRIPFFEATARSKTPVRALFFARFDHLPFLYHFIPGNEYLNKYNHIFTTAAGFEQLDSSDIQLLEKTGYWKYAKRWPYLEFLGDRWGPMETSVLTFLDRYPIDVLYIEDKPEFEGLLKSIRPRIENQYYVEVGHYFVCILHSKSRSPATAR